MLTLHGIQKIEPSKFRNAVVTIGVFDGVHLGHQALVSEVVSCARKMGVPAVVVTFDPHPSVILHPEKRVLPLFEREDMQAELAKMGVDVLVIEEFNAALARLSAMDFLQKFLLTPFGPSRIYIGYDFVFGQGRQGTYTFLQAQAVEKGFSVEQIPPILLDGRVVSSTLIRDLVALGDFVSVKAMLGRNFYFSGRVLRGDGRGHKIGFPTLNVFSETELYPRYGVYLTQVEHNGKFYNAVSNIGVRPTFYEKNVARALIETHILNANINLYDQDIKVHMLMRLRDELKFSNTEALVEQIKSDVQKAKEYFGV